jgi:hypothetical protein
MEGQVRMKPVEKHETICKMRNWETFESDSASTPMIHNFGNTEFNKWG